MYKTWICLTFLLLIFDSIKSQEIVKHQRELDSINEAIRKTPLFESKQWEVSEEQIIDFTDAQPAFGVFKDNFFATGIPFDRSINKKTADVLFQISIRHRLTRSRLPFHSFLYLTYTQKSFWDLYDKSAPFRDNNYNPGIGLGRYIVKNNKLYGITVVQLEHESNGKGEEESRSWNMLSLSAKYFVNYRLAVSGKVWLPFMIGSDNHNLINYKGLGYLSVEYLSKDQRWWATADVNPRKGFMNINTTLTAAYQISKNNNLYLYARFFQGKGESLLEYNQHTMNLRVGFCIKPDFSSIF